MDDCPEKLALPAHARDRGLLNKLSDGLIQLGAAEKSRGAAERNVISDAKEKEPTALSGRLALFLRSCCRGGCISPEGGRVTSSACALAKARRSLKT